MTERGLDNRQRAGGPGAVDEINARFYGRFPYPRPAPAFYRWSDPSAEAAFLNQALGHWEAPRVPSESRIWVAGCGTSEALLTALRFPAAEVIGSDLSASSLELCQADARTLGVTNLELRQESINQVDYRGEFDYVVCFGVLHHNSEPGRTLRAIGRSLRPGGVLELMVYNAYHWLLPAAAEKAIHALAGEGSDLELQLRVAKRLVERFPERGRMRRFLDRYRQAREEVVADVLLQPVAHTFTFEACAELVAGADLEILRPVIGHSRPSTVAAIWDVDLGDPELQARIQALPDLERWHAVHHLLVERSPRLWFYLTRREDGPRREEREVLRGFLASRPRCNGARRQLLTRRGDGSFDQPSPEPVGEPPGEDLGRIVDAADGEATVEQLLRDLSIPADPHRVHRICMQLTTPAFPFLRSVGSP